MNRKTDQELLRSFTAEANRYLLEILRGIEDFRRHPAQPERLEGAKRGAQTFKGAAAMVGLAALGDIAVRLEGAIENVAAGRLLLTNPVAAAMSEAVTLINAYLEEAAEGKPEETAPLNEALRRLSHLSESAGAARPRVEAPAAVAAVSPVEAGEVEDLASPALAAASISAELLDVFLPEAEEHLRAMSLALPALSDQPDDKELLQSIRRSTHSLKGSAGVVGFQEMARLAHRMEDLLDLLYDGQLPLTPERLDLLFASTDAFEDMVAGQPDPQRLRELYDSFERLLGLRQPEVAEPQQNQTSLPAIVRSEKAEGAAPGSPATMSQQRASFVRVPIEQLDAVVTLVTELIISNASFEQNLAEMQRQLDELRSSSTRLGRVATRMEGEYETSALGRGLQLAGANALNGATAPTASPAPEAGATAQGFDELELDRYTEFHLVLRGLAETTGDVQTLDRELGAIRDNLESCLNRQSRLSSEVQDKVMRLRMVPLATLSSRFMRAVRTVADRSGKAVRLVIEGEGTQIDKTVIEGMADPLLHFLRNAVDHGIEPAPVRQAQGKPLTGTIRLQAGYEGTQIVIQISDDGAGIDPERLRVAAINGGYISPHDAARVPVEDLLSLIFLPGFSTAEQVSEISGRGVGLDVARVAIHRLKGSVKVDSRPGEGATFTVRLPMTLAVMRALMVKVSHETFAIPLVGIKQILKIEPELIELIGKDPVLRVGETIYPLMSLAKLLSLKRPEERARDRRPVLLMNVEGRQVAIAVDETLGKREIVVKNMGNHLRQVHGVTGATLTGNGSVVLILNLAELVREAFRPRTQLAPTPAKRATMVSRRTLTVLVVDDSISVRRVLSNLIESAGWKPVQARDGLDAMELLLQLPAPPDLVLLDIEMPRMDGYEFIGALRQQMAYERTPIVILTSRAGQKHREKAFELGATDYVVKPYQDEALLGLIRQLTHQSANRN